MAERRRRAASLGRPLRYIAGSPVGGFLAVWSRGRYALEGDADRCTWRPAPLVLPAHSWTLNRSATNGRFEATRPVRPGSAKGRHCKQGLDSLPNKHQLEGANVSSLRYSAASGLVSVDRLGSTMPGCRDLVGSAYQGDHGYGQWHREMVQQHQRLRLHPA